MQIFITILFMSVGLIHIMPAIGVLGSERLLQLYGLKITDPNLLILMKHRAILLGVFGSFFVYSAFKTEHQWLAIIIGLVITSSFLVIVHLSAVSNQQLNQVFNLDVIAVGLLFTTSLLKWQMID